MLTAPTEAGSPPPVQAEGVLGQETSDGIWLSGGVGGSETHKQPLNWRPLFCEGEEGRLHAPQCGGRLQVQGKVR